MASSVSSTDSFRQPISLGMADEGAVSQAMLRIGPETHGRVTPRRILRQHPGGFPQLRSRLPVKRALPG